MPGRWNSLTLPTVVLRVHHDAGLGRLSLDAADPVTGRPRFFKTLPIIDGRPEFRIDEL